MKVINKIMVAIDFSDDSFAAAQYAARLAVDVDAKLFLTNVINQRDVDVMEIAVNRVAAFSVKKYVDEQTKNRSERLEDLANKINNGNTLDVKTSVRIGVPYQALLLEIKEKKPDLLVMGTKGRSNLVDTIIGSCARKMFRRSSIPLLSIRGN